MILFLLISFTILLVIYLLINLLDLNIKMDHVFKMMREGEDPSSFHCHDNNNCNKQENKNAKSNCTNHCEE